MAIQHLFDSLSWPAKALVLACIPFIYLACKILYRLSSLHPLAGVPGPIVARITDLPLIWHAYTGDEARYVHDLHLKYGPVVRIGTESVDFVDPGVIHPIYSHKGGFPKAKYYNNFDIDGHATIFSQTDPAARGARAKAVLPMFSIANIRKGSKPFTESIERFLASLREKKASGSANVLECAREMSIEAVTEYLFGIRYGSSSDASDAEAQVTKEKPKLSASDVVDNFISTGRLWYFVPWLYNLADRLDAFIYPNPSVKLSTDIVNEYVDRVIAAAQVEAERTKDDKAAWNTYPCRLLLAGFSPSEVHAQCKDVLFAATDTIGITLGTLLFMLAKHPDVYDKLHAEVASATIAKSEDIQQLPYLGGVVREAIRFTGANPCRLPREVIAGGWHYGGRFYPAGTVVSASLTEMHYSEDIYPDAHAFKPERWANATDEMHKCNMAFGLGARSCVARAMSLWELFNITYDLAKEDTLRGSRVAKDHIEVYTTFNSKVKSGSIEIVWPRD
ncbi:cytochrome P450 oxidoreductase [Hypoxylon sp. FL1150]|nr:cytochrome P450 oxidoreductase [Hypoxylon sp. FL1150]